LALTITSMPPVSVFVSPASATLAASQTQQFTATVSNSTNTAVNWTISPNMGSISSTGLYTAPANIASQQTITVTATSLADSTKSAAATITLTPPSNAAACQVTYADSNDWGTGFTGSISVTNNGSSAINGWTLGWVWTGNQQITQAWNSSYSQSGSSVTVTNADWDATISPGATVSGIAFTANYSGSNSSPATFYLNGSQCSGSGFGGTLPAAPSNLFAAAVSSGRIQLTWTGSDTSGITYNVYASTSPGVIVSPAQSVATGITGTTFTHLGLTASTTYYYVVTAVNASGESTASNQASASTGGASCQVTYVDQNDWGVGFTGAISITNTSNLDIQGWTLTWQWPGNQQISSAWNANSTQNGSAANLNNSSWNANISPGATISGIGFNASYTGANSPPTTFYLNGVQCQ
jgi:hypothetical protein